METIIIYNNKKGFVKMVSNGQGLGVVCLPITNKQELMQENNNIWEWLGV